MAFDPIPMFRKGACAPPRGDLFGHLRRCMRGAGFTADAAALVIELLPESRALCTAAAFPTEPWEALVLSMLARAQLVVMGRTVRRRLPLAPLSITPDAWAAEQSRWETAHHLSAVADRWIYGSRFGPCRGDMLSMDEDLGAEVRYYQTMMHLYSNENLQNLLTPWRAAYLIMPRYVDMGDAPRVQWGFTDLGIIARDAGRLPIAQPAPEGP